jgi:hypothetical protein
MLNIGTFQVEISVGRRGCEAEEPLKSSRSGTLEISGLNGHKLNKIVDEDGGSN